MTKTNLAEIKTAAEMAPGKNDYYLAAKLLGYGTEAAEDAEDEIEFEIFEATITPLR